MERSERKSSFGEANSSVTNSSDTAGVDTPLNNSNSNYAPAQPQDFGKTICERPNVKINRLVSNISNETGESLRSSFQGSVDVEKTRRVNRILEQCEAVGWPFRKKLILANLNLSFADIPIEGICSEKIGPFLYKLSLKGNSIFAVPDSLVSRLTGLKTLDLSNCGLEELPNVWDLPSLKKLCLGRNKLTTFPADSLFRGSPMLENLDMYENGLTDLRLPNELALLSKLEHLNLNYNSIAIIPADELTMLRALKTFKIMNNCITTVPELVCEMDLRVLDVMSNPLIQPPLETCARGLSSMRRYYTCLRAEEGSEKSNPKRFLRATARKMKAFPASLRWSIRSVSDPNFSNLSENASMSRTGSLEGASKADEAQEIFVSLDAANKKTGEIAINDTLKVVFVGMALSGKTSIIKRLIEGESARMPSLDDRTVGVDIYPWKPGSEKCDNETSNDKKDQTKSIFEAPLNTQIEVNENLQSRLKTPLDVKFSMWDFAGQDCYHATHELFFSSRALYVLVWDMAASNPQTMWKRTSLTLSEEEQGEFNLLDSSDEEDEENYLFDSVEKRCALRALEKDIDDKVNFWVETIQASAPGAAILPVASFDDYFSEQEATMRCKIMKDRLLKKEMARVEGMKQRLDKFHSSQEGDSREAMLVKKLLSPWNRPKLIFGIHKDDVIRVSSETGSGFDSLAAGIVNVATGRETGQWPYPIFHGHIGARIPWLWLEVRNLVRKMRGRFKVVESGYFLNKLLAKGIDNPDDISDALHFLTNIGELSYFGERSNRHDLTESTTSSSVTGHSLYGDDHKSLSLSTPRHQSSTSSVESKSRLPFGFDDFIFLNPRWLVAAIACILRHDLTREIYEVRRLIAETKGSVQKVKADEISDVVDTDLNYPVISSRDVFLLWQTKRFTQKAAVRALQYSNNDKVTPFDFLQKILVRFSVFVPLDLTIDRACLGGKDFTHFDANVNSPTCPGSHEDGPAKFFFIPSLLGPEEPKDAWSFKTVDSWKTTLCHTIVFPDGSPPGLMERLTGSILNDFNTASASASDGITDTSLRLKETLCWRSAFLIRIAMDVIDGGTVAESIVDIFVTLVDQESSYCVASHSMSVGMRKLIISARGQSGDYGSKIWKGGYMRVIVMTTSFLSNEYSGLEFECQSACPQCLSYRPIAQCCVWNPPTLFTLAEKDSLIRCRYGHGVDIRLLTALQGRFKSIVIKPPTTSLSYLQDNTEADTVPISKIFKSVVFVGVWDEVSQRILHAGSGFFVDQKRGFVVTVGHILLDSTWRERSGKIVIGVIPSDSENVCCFRYFARIISKDPSIKDNGFCMVDACVLQLLSRMESDVFHSGTEIGDQPEKLLMNNPDAMKKEKLTSLSVTEKIELDETIRILGFNQGGEGLMEPGSEVHRSADFARGYVVMRFAASVISEHTVSKSFQPRSEIVVICPTIGGHSGGPCINQQGEVIGILSRVDPTDKQRCYLVPSSEFNPLIKEAKRALVYGL